MKINELRTALWIPPTSVYFYMNKPYMQTYDIFIAVSVFYKEFYRVIFEEGGMYKQYEQLIKLLFPGLRCERRKNIPLYNLFFNSFIDT